MSLMYINVVGQSLRPSVMACPISTGTLAPRLDESLFQKSLDVTARCFKV